VCSENKSCVFLVAEVGNSVTHTISLFLLFTVTVKMLTPFCALSSGSLINLAKHPASTVQILGAEKALFRALKTKKDTPKYGLIYHSTLVGQTSTVHKGKVREILQLIIEMQLPDYLQILL
jgi:hypothetical protein